MNPFIRSPVYKAITNSVFIYKNLLLDFSNEKVWNLAAVTVAFRYILIQAKQLTARVLR